MSDLRQRKFARTRLALAESLATALAQQSLSDVSVKALCREAEVSEATFFNYFPRKRDLMAYLAQLWLLELGWYLHTASSQGQGLNVIDKLFSQTAQSCVQAPGVFRELLVWLARGGKLDQSVELSAVEKQLAFPQLEGIGNIPVKGIDAWLVPQLELAIAEGHLPSNTLLPTLLSSLLAILLGVPLTLLDNGPEKVAGMYRRQLTLLWSGARAAAQGR